MKPFILYSTGRNKILEFDGKYWFIYDHQYDEEPVVLWHELLERSGYPLVHTLREKGYYPEVVLGRICWEQPDNCATILRLFEQREIYTRRILLWECEGPGMSHNYDYVYIIYDPAEGFCVEFSNRCEELMDFDGSSCECCSYNELGEEVQHSICGITSATDLYRSVLAMHRAYHSYADRGEWEIDWTIILRGVYRFDPKLGMALKAIIDNGPPECVPENQLELELTSTG